MATALSIADLTTAGRWEQVDLTGEFVADYRSLTGGTGPEPPIGMSIVWARRGFTRLRPLPPGGVLLGIELDSLRVPPVGGPIECRVEHEVSTHRSGHLFVRIVTDLRDGSGSIFARVVFVVRWPHA